MYVRTSKYGRKRESFFSSEDEISTKHESLDRDDDEPLVDSQPIADAVHKSMGIEHEHGKESILEKPQHNNHNENNGKRKQIKTRRGYGRKNKRKQSKVLRNIKFSILGTNSNGISNKVESLKHNINIFQPSVLTLQETKARKLGSIRLEGYQIFENIRVGGGGGGLLTAVDQNLKPVLISTGKDEETEILTVQAKVGIHDVRIVNAYGPQEDDGKQDVYKFWQEVEQEIITAKDENCLVVIQLDANAKLARKIIKVTQIMLLRMEEYFWM